MSSYVQLSSKNFLILSWNSGKVYFSAVRARIFTKFELVTLEAKYFTTFNYSHHQTKPGWVRGKKTSCTMVLLLGLFDYCQAQPQLQLNWAELALFSISTLNLLILSRKSRKVWSVHATSNPTHKPLSWSLLYILSEIFVSHFEFVTIAKLSRSSSLTGLS